MNEYNQTNILEELQNCKFKLESINSSINNIDSSVITLEEEGNSLKYKYDNIIESKTYYKKAIDIIYERSIAELKDVINSALNYIFTDRNLEIDIELSDKRGKSMTFIIKNNGRKVNLKRGMGMGVKCVISCILHIYYLQCKNSKVLMLDEAYSNISKEYVTNFFDFLNKLCKNLDFTIIWVTHDERFIPYADKVYRINNGYVSVGSNVKK